MSSLAVGVDKQVYGLSEAIMLIELSGYFLSYRILESSGGSSVSQNKLPQLILGYIYILKYLQSNFIG